MIKFHLCFETCTVPSAYPCNIQFGKFVNSSPYYGIDPLDEMEATNNTLESVATSNFYRLIGNINNASLYLR